MRLSRGHPPDPVLPDPVFTPRLGTGGAGSPHDTDAEVILRSLGDPEGFAEIFRRHFTTIHRYAAARLGAAADDVAAETFLAAFRQRERYDTTRPDARAWLFGIATNLIRRHHRDEARLYRTWERARDASLLDAGTRSEGSGDQQRRLSAALGALRPGDRDVLLLVAYGGLSYVEVADALGIPAGTVGSRLNRARKRVRDILRSDGRRDGGRDDG
ncbi:RNA polymerase sigma factor [Nonomuraea sp. NPDC047897]|uniref:RNA polymerase sigma factor n=1 Tax=Nonomuraea sp. NPDC047897 TaxID=3364346 RepID=UPI003712BC1B